MCQSCLPTAPSKALLHITPGQRCCPPCLLDKAQRGALHGQSLPYRDLFCPRKPLSLNTGSGQLLPGWVPTGMPGISPGKGSRCLARELKWEKGLMSVVGFFTQLFICVTALHTTSTAGSRVNRTPSPAGGKFASHRFGCFQKRPQVQPNEGCVGVHTVHAQAHQQEHGL